MASFEIHECRVCGNRYEELQDDRHHKSMSKYIHYLGMCDSECWDNITQKHKDLLMFRAAVMGDDRKRNKIPVSKKHLIKK
tara:strand:+ start:563 stop:805 length:243 start_codon:yes stop_codon:yes gene_type:complete